MDEFKINENKELNASAREYGESAEYRTPQEFGASEPNFEATEDNTENNRVRKRGGTERTKRLGDALKMFCIAVVSVVAVIAVAAATALPGDTAAEIVSLSATDTSISYTVDVSGGEELELRVTNDFTHRAVKLTDGENTGEIVRLKPNMQYTVSVVYQSVAGERTVTEYVVRTEKYAVAGPISAFYSIEHGCTCNVDGYFHFTLDFIDENGYWSDFNASLEDERGNISYCTFTDDMHEEQSIDVVLNAGLLGNTATFTFSFKADDLEHVPDTDLFTCDERTGTLTYCVTVKI